MPKKTKWIKCEFPAEQKSLRKTGKNNFRPEPSPDLETPALIDEKYNEEIVKVVQEKAADWKQMRAKSEERAKASETEREKAAKIVRSMVGAYSVSKRKQNELTLRLTNKLVSQGFVHDGDFN